MRRTKHARKGDFVHFCGHTYQIGELLFSDWCGTWSIEFLDTNGRYHHWNEYYDKGELIPAGVATKKRRINRFGDDCTDLFVKYGML